MSLSTLTYSELESQVEALCGGAFTDSEKARVKSNVNLAKRRIFNSSMWWERFLVVSEPRSVERGDIAFTEDSFSVYGAGTTGVDGLYKRNGTANTKAKYTKYASDGTTAEYDIEWDGATDWQLLTAADAVLYDITDASATPPLSGWAANTGAVTAPLLVDVGTIGTCLHVNRYNLHNNGDYSPIKYHVTARGITLSSNNDEDIAYVTYKAPITAVYGDGTEGTTEDIPEEWFDYLALHAAYTYQHSARQSNSSPFVALALREVNDARDDALARQEEQNISNTVAKRIQTHLQYSTQLN